MFNILTTECLDWVKPRFEQRYDYIDFGGIIKKYESLSDFKISENVFEKNADFDEELHFLMRLISQYHMECVFRAMKIDMTDPNVSEDLSTGNIGTPGRVAKVWCGFDTHDTTELLSGRWTKRPRIASFPNESNQKFPITKRVDLVSVCSHHTSPFSTMFRPDSYAIVSYIPEETILGISKLQRLVDWVSRRGHLQEGLTEAIYNEVCKAAETKNVYVKLCNIVHTCESLRGSQAKDGSFTSEFYGGEFNNIEIRRQVQNSIK